jgi:hypothetical protein
VTPCLCRQPAIPFTSHHLQHSLRQVLCMKKRNIFYQCSYTLSVESRASAAMQGLWRVWRRKGALSDVCDSRSGGASSANVHESRCMQHDNPRWPALQHHRGNRASLIEIWGPQDLKATSFGPVQVRMGFVKVSAAVRFMTPRRAAAFRHATSVARRRRRRL